jgi:hypothetical protein
LGGWGEIEIKVKLSPAKAEAELGKKPVSYFYHGPLVKRGRDQHMAILLLLFSSLLLLQSSIGPIRAKQIARCSSVIG